MDQPLSFSRHLKSLVRNELVVAGISHLPSPQSCHLRPACPPWPGGAAGSHTGSAHHTHGNNLHPQCPGAGKEASSAEGPTGRLHTELEDDLGWKMLLEITWPYPTPPRAGPAQVLLLLLQDFSKSQCQ